MLYVTIRYPCEVVQYLKSWLIIVHNCVLLHIILQRAQHSEVNILLIISLNMI
jgi:hypothetical protein